MAKLETIEIETGKNPTAAIIGCIFGRRRERLRPHRELGLEKGPAVRFVFPHAPMRPVTINNGYVMRAWYDVLFGNLEGTSRKADEQGVRDSEGQIGALIERETKRGIPAESIVLAGFSQGGAIALQTGLRYPEKLAGIMALSTYLPLAAVLPQEASPANRKPPLRAHGIFDPVVAYLMGTTCALRPPGSKHNVEWHGTPCSIWCVGEVADIGTWLRKVLKT
jgi:phospholipase/carboxylesterase